MKISLFCAMICIFAVSCTKQKEGSSEPSLVFRIRFDSTQERLNNLGQPAEIPAGHAAQNPSFNEISVHYVELANDASTALGSGAVLYKAPETNAGGETAGIPFAALVAISAYALSASETVRSRFGR